MSTVLQTDIQTRSIVSAWAPIPSPPRVYAQIPYGSKWNVWTRYRFLADSVGRLVCPIDNQDHVDFLIATGNFSILAE